MHACGIIENYTKGFGVFSLREMLVFRSSKGVHI